jgi:hypothetical protein
MSRLARVLLLMVCVILAGSRLALAAGGACPSSVPSDITNCFYFDFANGSDSNSGTAESAPWKDLPGATPVVNNVGPGTIDDYAGDKCGSSPCNYSHTGFILRGGVSWTATEWPMVMRLQGTSLTARVYWGVDPTWYVGSVWARPILNFGGTSGPKCNTMVQWAPVQYVVWDNMEFTNLYWDHTCNGAGNGKETYLGENGSASGGSYNEIEHLYMHGWAHEAYAPNNTADACDLISGTTQGTDTGSFAHDNVIDGADVDNSSGYSCVVFWGSPPTLYNNYITDVANGFVGFDPVDFHQNTLMTLGASYDTTQHTQFWESNSDNGFVMYNNVFAHGTTIGLGVNMSTVHGATSYVWNNLMYDLSNNNNIWDVSYPAGGVTKGGTFYFWNNTTLAGVVGGASTSSVIGCLSGSDGCHFANNQLITSATPVSGNSGSGAALICPASNCTQSNNILQSQAAASAQGYLPGSTYPYSPPPGGSTIGAGTNLTSTSPGCNTPGLTTLCTDTTVGVGLNTNGYTVVVPNRTALNRSGSGTWDSGGYLYSATQAPQPPTNLTATVN